jgi:hypothetical protein
MTGILDLYMTRTASRPASSLDDVFGIALARALGDAKLVDLYLKVAADYPHAVLANAAKKLLRKGTPESPAFTSFYRALTRESFDGSGTMPEVVALKVDRLAIGAGVLFGTRLSHTELLTLRYSDDDAARSGAGLVRRLAVDHPNASFALETYSETATRRAKVIAGMLQAAQEVGVPVWTFAPDVLYAAYCVPTCKTREEVRAIVASLFPQRDLIGRDTETDALAVGILAYCRILLNSEAEKDAP